MKTSKPISTISYNSERFLREKIYYWKECGIIEYGMWILHQPDQDGDKPHYHVYLQPSKLIQTDFLITDSIEIDPSWKPLENYADEKEKERHEKKRFLKMTIFKSSDTSNWILYALHDENYLLQKGLTRNHHYEPSDIITTCDETFYEMLSSAYDFRNNKLEFRIIEGVQEGKSWADMVKSGMIPIRQIAGARLLYMALTGQERNAL